MSQIAVILGFGTGVGEGILESFLAAGYSVAIVARTKSKLDVTADKYTA